MLHDQIVQFTDAGAATGNAVVTFEKDSLSLLAPRGRFDVEMYLSSLKLTGQVRYLHISNSESARIANPSLQQHSRDEDVPCCHAPYPTLICSCYYYTLLLYTITTHYYYKVLLYNIILIVAATKNCSCGFGPYSSFLNRQLHLMNHVQL